MSCATEHQYIATINSNLDTSENAAINAQAFFAVEMVHANDDQTIDVRVLPVVRACMLQCLDRFAVGNPSFDLGINPRYLANLVPDQFGLILISGLKAVETKKRPYSGAAGWIDYPMFFWDGASFYEEAQDQGYMVGPNASFFSTLSSAFDLIEELMTGAKCRRCGDSLRWTEFVQTTSGNALLFSPAGGYSDPTERICIECFAYLLSDQEKEMVRNDAIPAFGHRCEDEWGQENVEVDGVEQKANVERCRYCNDRGWVDLTRERSLNRHRVKHP